MREQFLGLLSVQSGAQARFNYTGDIELNLRHSLLQRELFHTKGLGGWPLEEHLGQAYLESEFALTNC